MTDQPAGAVPIDSIQRPPDAFQQPVDPTVLIAICERSLGAAVRIRRIMEIGIGTYNNTYRIDLAGRESVILRIAPEFSRQSRAGRDAMRNEHATAPFLAMLGDLVPRTIAVDFTHQIVNRDYLVQTLLPGEPASAKIAAYSAGALAHLYRELGSITRAIHSVRGRSFGPVAGPFEATWSAALIARYHELAGDFDDGGVDSTGIHRLIDAADARRAVLDDVTEPRLLHGDLWTLNLLVDSDSEKPAITGVLDCDSAYWGDPMSDWTINRVRTRAGTEVDAFWETYGAPAEDAGSATRALFYRARNVIGARLDIHRRGLELADISPIHWDLTEVLAALG